MRLYYAQNREDLLIKSFFPDIKEGFYIDVGANDPVIDSVTKLFYDEGWSGINIDPIKRHYNALSKLRPRDMNLQIGLSDNLGKLSFTEYPEGDGLSTFDDSMQQFYASADHPFPTAKLKKYEVEVQTLARVLERADQEHIHFIKIDVEGYEYRVIKGYDWKGLRPELICIEANHIHDDWRPILAASKYHEVFFDGVNNYYLAEESLHRKDFFNYPDAVFSGNPVYFPAFKEISKEAERPLEELRSVVVDRESQIVTLQEREHNVRFLAKQLYGEVKARVEKRGSVSSVELGLAYKGDKRLESFTDESNVSKVDMLRQIHDLDMQNVVYKKRDTKASLRTAFWRFVGRSMTFSAHMTRDVITLARK
jgi:FkbM family methyltransferase